MEPSDPTITAICGAVILNEAARSGGRSGAPTGCRFREVGAARRGCRTAAPAQPLQPTAVVVYRAWAWPPGFFGLLATASRPRLRPRFPGCCVGVCAVSPSRHPGHYPGDVRQVVARPVEPGVGGPPEATLPGTKLSRGVASLPDRHAPGGFRVVHNSRLGHWCTGFSMLLLNDAVNPELKATDPMATVQRIAIMLFEE